MWVLIRCKFRGMVRVEALSYDCDAPVSREHVFPDGPATKRVICRFIAVNAVFAGTAEKQKLTYINKLVQVFVALGTATFSFIVRFQFSTSSFRAGTRPILQEHFRRVQY